MTDLKKSRDFGKALGDLLQTKDVDLKAISKQITSLQKKGIEVLDVNVHQFTGKDTARGITFDAKIPIGDNELLIELLQTVKFKDLRMFSKGIILPEWRLNVTLGSR